MFRHWALDIEYCPLSYREKTLSFPLSNDQYPIPNTQWLLSNTE